MQWDPSTALLGQEWRIYNLTDKGLARPGPDVATIDEILPNIRTLRNQTSPAVYNTAHT